VLAGVLVVSVLLSWPGWLETQLRAWKVRHDMTNPGFTEDKVINSIDSFVYWRAYNVSHGQNILNEYSALCSRWQNIKNVL